MWTRSKKHPSFLPTYCLEFWATKVDLDVPALQAALRALVRDRPWRHPGLGRSEDIHFSVPAPSSWQTHESQKVLIHAHYAVRPPQLNALQNYFDDLAEEFIRLYEPLIKGHAMTAQLQLRTRAIGNYVPRARTAAA